MRITWLQPVVIWYKNTNALVAQLDRVLGYEPSGHRFESCRVHQTPKSPPLKRAFCRLGFAFFRDAPSLIRLHRRAAASLRSGEMSWRLRGPGRQKNPARKNNSQAMALIVLHDGPRGGWPLHFPQALCFLFAMGRRTLNGQGGTQVCLASACFQPRFFNV